MAAVAEVELIDHWPPIVGPEPGQEAGEQRLGEGSQAEGSLGEGGQRRERLTNQQIARRRQESASCEVKGRIARRLEVEEYTDLPELDHRTKSLIVDAIGTARRRRSADELVRPLVGEEAELLAFVGDAAPGEDERVDVIDAFAEQLGQLCERDTNDARSVCSS